MIEESNDIFLAGGDALVYLVQPMNKNYSTAVAWGHPFSTYVSYDRFFNQLSLHSPTHILDDPTSIPPVV